MCHTYMCKNQYIKYKYQYIKQVKSNIELQLWYQMANNKNDIIETIYKGATVIALLNT